MVRSRGYFNRFGCDYIITDDDCRLMSIHSELTSTLYFTSDRAQRNQVHRSSSSGTPIQPPYLNSLAKLSSMIASCNNYRRSYIHERGWLSPPLLLLLFVCYDSKATKSDTPTTIKWVYRYRYANNNNQFLYFIIIIIL